VKKLGQLMIDDHTEALGALRKVASQHDLEVPAQVDDKRRDQPDKLAKKQGLDFDKAYCDEMVDSHQDLIDKLESRIDKANLAEYKAQMKDRVAGTTVEEKRQAIAIIPEKSDNPVTMSVNQWAADTYPIAAAHLAAARTLKDDLKRRTTH
jgi:predicted outer membrane protein